MCFAGYSFLPVKSDKHQCQRGYRGNASQRQAHSVIMNQPASYNQQCQHQGRECCPVPGQGCAFWLKTRISLARSIHNATSTARVSMTPVESPQLSQISARGKGSSESLRMALSLRTQRR